MTTTPDSLIANLAAVRDNISPIQASLSPNSLQQFGHTISKLTGQIVAKLGGGSLQRRKSASSSEEGAERNEGDQNANEEDEPPLKTVTKASIAVRSQKRVHNIIKVIGDPPITAEHWVSMLAPGVREGMKTADVEDNALKAILRGYDSSDLQQWRKSVEALSQAPACPESLAEFKEADTLTDLKSRLVARQEVLRVSAEGGTSDIYHRYVMNQVASIKFDIDWEAMGKGKGGTKRKTSFYEGAFYVERGGQSDDPNLKKKAKAAVVNNKAEYEKWRRSLGEVLTARNRAKVAYQALGSGMLMDPFWDVAVLMPNKRTKEFTHVLSEVVKYVGRLAGDAQEDMEESREDTETVRTSVMGILDEGLENYIRVFRREYM